MPGRNGTPALFGRFTLLRPLARSASGSTWLAIDEGAPDQPHVALRLFNGRAGALIKRDGTFADRLERLRGRAMTGLPTLRAFGSEDSHCYAVFSWRGGEALDQVMANATAELSPIHRSRLVRQLARGLSTLHRNDFLHLSLSPSTILYDRERNSLRLVDWGHMHPKSEAGPAGPACPDGALDIAPYTSPGAPVDIRDDVFDFGCVAYELLTGAHPYDRRSASEAAARGLVPPPAPALSSRQNRAISAALTLDPSRRNITLDAAARAFTHRSQVQPIVAAWVRLRRIDPNRRSAVAIFALLAFCVVYGGLAIWDASQSPAAVASAPVLTAPPIDVVVAAEAKNPQQPDDAPAARSQAGPAVIAAKSDTVRISAPPARRAEPEIARQESNAVSNESDPELVRVAATNFASRGASASKHVDIAFPPPVSMEPAVPNLPVATAPGSLTSPRRDQPVSYRASGPSCFNCDCPTLSNKRSFSTDPLRREEQEYLRRHCG